MCRIPPSRSGIISTLVCRHCMDMCIDLCIGTQNRLPGAGIALVYQCRRGTTRFQSSCVHTCAYTCVRTDTKLNACRPKLKCHKSQMSPWRIFIEGTVREWLYATNLTPTHMSIKTCKLNVSVCISTQMSICMSTHMFCMHVYACLHPCLYTNMYTCLYARPYTAMYKWGYST